MTGEHDALVQLALEVDASAAAVLLDVLHRAGRVSSSVLSCCVPIAWDLCSWPMSVLPAERWVGLFRAAGYTHEFEPAEAPAGPLRLFRGSDAAGELGMCWSTNLDVARWLASAHPEGWVWSAEVEGWRLLAFLAAGYEDQFVVDTTGLATRVVETPVEVAALDREALAERLDAVVFGAAVS